MFYAIINYQFKTGDLTKFREVGEASGSSIKVLVEYTWNVHYCTICEIIGLVGGP